MEWTLKGRVPECGKFGQIAQDLDAMLAAAQPPAAAPQQPEIGEEIMVNAAHDVFILPLQPSGLSSGPRFVVHVPAPAQKFKVGDRVVACETFYHDEVQGIRVGAYGTVRESRYNGEIFLVDFDGITPSKGHDGAWEMFAHQLELAPDTRPAALAAQQQGGAE